MGDTVRSVMIPCRYGNIKFHLREVMDAKGLSRNQLAKLTGTRFEVVDKWYRGNVERIDTDVLARFCFTLECSISDIIEYVK